MGIAEVMFDLPMVGRLIPPYLLITRTTLGSDERYVNIGWESAGVTTGPIKPPLVLAIGFGCGGSPQSPC